MTSTDQTACAPITAIVSAADPADPADASDPRADQRAGPPEVAAASQPRVAAEETPPAQPESWAQEADVTGRVARAEAPSVSADATASPASHPPPNPVAPERLA